MPSKYDLRGQTKSSNVSKVSGLWYHNEFLSSAHNQWHVTEIRILL